MNNEISFQQLRAPIAVALTVILNSMFALPSDARLTDLSKVESPLILASILFIFRQASVVHRRPAPGSGARLRRQKARTLNPLAGIRMEVHPPPRTTH